MKTPPSAKTPGLATCFSEGCSAKVVPGFGRGVCKRCEEELRTAVAGVLGCEMGEEGSSAMTVTDGKSSEEEEGSPPIEEEMMMREEQSQTKDDHVRLFAIPSTPLTSHNPLADSLATSPRSELDISGQSEESNTPLFALPNVALDTEAYEEITPVTKYARNFPALPTRADGVVQRDLAGTGKPWVTTAVSEPVKVNMRWRTAGRGAAADDPR